MRMGLMGRSTGRRVAVAVTATGALACGALLPAVSAQADLDDDKARIEKRIDMAQEDLEHLSSELRHADAVLRDTRAQVPAAQNALASAQAAQADAAARNESAKAELARAQAEEAKAQAELESTTSEMDATRSQVAGFAAQLYQEQGSGTLAIALEATDPQQLADRMSYADALMDVQAGALSELSSTRAALTADEDRLGALRAQVAAAQQETKRTLAEATAAASAAQQAKTELDNLVARQEEAAANLDAETAAEKKHLASLESQSDAITAKLQAIAAAEAKRRAQEKARQEAAARAEEKRRAQAARAQRSAGRKAPANAAPQPSAPEPNTPEQPPTPSSGGGFFTAPSQGWISSEFGMRFHPILNYWRLHSGRDYAANCGTPVVAAAPGTLVSAGWGGGYGNQVIVSHGLVGGEPLATTYNHLSSIVVSGSTVTRGQLLGYVGTTGLSTGCHLHFEARVNGVPKDPRNWL